jgi:two-component system, NtrC family, response regulator HydG
MLYAPWEITNANEITVHQNDTNNNVTDDFSNKALGLKDAASRAEYEAIMNVLKEVNFNKTKAAELLKIDRKTLYNKIRSFEESNN